MLREDIARAVQSAPSRIREQLNHEAAESLELLNSHLTENETVRLVSSASPKQGGTPNSVLAITEHRLIFVAPAPQAVAWRLASLKRSQVYAGYFFVEGDAGDYSLGMVDDDWGRALERAVKQASAEAVLRGL